MIARVRRLPGVRFETRSPALPEALPRMDIAAFVGFAASGPLHLPVAVEDGAHFAAIFGEAPALAWDAARGESVRAQLAPAVHAFFRGGGERCWVVRVAGAGATTNTFAVPGLITLDAEGRIAPARLAARSPGSWSDEVEVAAALLAEAVVLESADLGAGLLTVRPPARGALVAGDLLRVRAGESVGLLVVERAEAEGAPGGRVEAANRTRITLRTSIWMRPATAPALPEEAAGAWLVGAAGETALPLLPVPLAPAPGGGVELLLAGDVEAAPPPGALLRVATSTGDLWLVVYEGTAALAPGSPPIAALRLRAVGMQRTAPPPTLERLAAQRLTLELWTRTPTTRPRRLDDLGFAPGHPRWWDTLPSDAALYGASDAAGRLTAAGETADLWIEASALPLEAEPTRWPLAGAHDAARVALPLALDPLPLWWAGADPQPGDALTRDGLASVGAHLFLDADLVESGSLTLLESADFLRYGSPTPRTLMGIHAALALDEVTLIAAPDAAHRGWDPQQIEQPTPPVPMPSPLRPEWFGGDPCAAPCPPDAQAPPPAAPRWERFLACGLDVVETPVLTPLAQVAQEGAYTLAWSAVAPGGEPGAPDTLYELEEAALPTFADAQLVQSGEATSHRTSGRGPGDRYYRVRARRGGAFSNWSAPGVVRVAAGGGWQLRPPQAGPSMALAAVQRGLLRLCAARGDLFAVLALPEGAREDDAIAHVALLKSAAAPPLPLLYPTSGGMRTVVSQALGYGEARAFSFGALYFPWLAQRNSALPDSAAAVPLLSPEGAACGQLARRARERGAWVAPANDRLPDIVALAPAPARARLLDLQEAQVNVIRQEPRGFLLLEAATLSDDPALRLINVRRLLILLRRLALRTGARHVFEPNSASFRRLVERSFEALLDDLWVRGAFAGATPQAAYQVVVGEALNTGPSVEAGRLLVELRVAPARPMRFLTVRLVQTPERTVVTE